LESIRKGKRQRVVLDQCAVRGAVGICGGMGESVSDEEYLTIFWDWVPEDWQEYFKDKEEVNKLALAYKYREFAPHLGACELFK
jgi:hypothetical protein